MQPSRQAADPAVGVRVATEFDVPTLATTLTAAFQGYVWTDWVLPPVTRGDRMVRCFDNDLRAVIKYWGQVWMTPDGTSAAAWIAPEPPPMPEAEEKDYTRRFRDLLADRTDLVTSAEAAVRKFLPAGRHWYLATMGTVPEARRRGAVPQFFSLYSSNVTRPAYPQPWIRLHSRT